MLKQQTEFNYPNIISLFGLMKTLILVTKKALIYVLCVILKTPDRWLIVWRFVFVGETVDLGENEAVALAEPVVRPLREKMVYMSVGDGHHTQTDGERFCLFHNVKLFFYQCYH